MSRSSGVAPRELGARIDQIDRIERAAAVVALVAARVGVAAVRAGSLDVAVGQESLTCGSNMARLASA